MKKVLTFPVDMAKVKDRCAGCGEYIGTQVWRYERQGNFCDECTGLANRLVDARTRDRKHKGDRSNRGWCRKRL